MKDKQSFDLMLYRLFQFFFLLVLFLPSPVRAETKRPYCNGALLVLDEYFTPEEDDLCGGLRPDGNCFPIANKGPVFPMTTFTPEALAMLAATEGCDTSTMAPYDLYKNSLEDHQNFLRLFKETGGSQLSESKIFSIMAADKVGILLFSPENQRNNAYISLRETIKIVLSYPHNRKRYLNEFLNEKLAFHFDDYLVGDVDSPVEVRILFDYVLPVGAPNFMDIFEPYFIAERLSLDYEKPIDAIYWANVTITNMAQVVKSCECGVVEVELYGHSLLLMQRYMANFQQSLLGKIDRIRHLRGGGRPLTMFKDLFELSYEPPVRAEKKPVDRPGVIAATWNGYIDSFKQYFSTAAALMKKDLDLLPPPSYTVTRSVAIEERQCGHRLFCPYLKAQEADCPAADPLGILGMQ